jgi:hypothetical protein
MTGEKMQPGPGAARALAEKLSGAWIAQAISTVATLGIADHLLDGPLPASILAQRVGADSSALYRVLRALASQGIFAEEAEGHFALTALAEPLRGDVPGSQRAYAMMLGTQWHWRSWGELLHTVRTGKPAFDHVFGQPVFAYYADHPEAQRMAVAALTSRSAAESVAIVRSYGFADSAVVDLAGGEGSLLAAILQANPHARGTLFERPLVLASARPLLEKAAVADRCELMAGDFFATVPRGGDVYILKKVIHDWDDDRATAILRNCRAAMGETARLLLIETIVPPGNEPSSAKLLDLLMLIYAGGRERTETEYRALLAGADFDMRRIISTPAGINIIEAA